jgi:hypothetical protein
MSYRYNSIDIVVGVGLCAILFGALLLFIATTGTFLVGGPQSSGIDVLPSTASAWLQPALGQAIVDRSLLQRHTEQITASATSEWIQAMQSHRSLQNMTDRSFGFVMHRAVEVPNDHAARVQTVMGRSIVNFTQRGIRSGALSANLYLSDYNQAMIDATEKRGKQMNQAFASTWQSVLGKWIVDVSREQWRRVADVQEQLGTAIVHMTQARTVLEEAWSANQYQLGSLLAAVDRTGALDDRRVQQAQLASATTTHPEAITASSGMPAIPDVSIGYLMAAALALCSIFFGGLLLSAASREAKALADSKRNAARWVYRMA